MKAIFSIFVIFSIFFLILSVSAVGADRAFNERILKGFKGKYGILDKEAITIEGMAKEAELQRINAIPESLLVESSPAVVDQWGRKIMVHFDDTEKYIIDRKPSSYKFDYGWLGVGLIVIESDGDMPINNKYYKFNGETKIVKFSSSNESVLEISSEGEIKYKSAGYSVVSIIIGSKTIKYKKKVFKLPLHIDMTQDKLIEVIGLPDKKSVVHVPWTERRTVNGIEYYNSSKPYGFTIEHWMYDKYPNLIMSFKYGKLSGCTKAIINDLYSKKTDLY
jgi:hypothetical protein